MTDFIGSVWWMIVSLGLLVTFHEFGHYWVGRLCGVKVLRFSVGFGRPLWSRRDRHGTEFAIAAIPLGGYVKFLDEREVEVHPHERGQAFNHKTVWQRIAIVAAGPIANLLLCILLLWAMFVIGKQDYSATVGRATGMAATAGLGSGDRLLSVDGRDVITLGEASMALTAAAMDRRDVTLEVLDPADQLRSRTLPLSQLPAGFDERRVPILAGVYWRAWLQPPLVDNIVKGSAAEGHLQTGDLIVAIDGQRIDSVEQAISEVGSLGRRGGPAMIEVLRGGERLALEITPRQGKDGKGQPTWQIGAGFAQSYSPAYDTLLKFGPLQSVTVAVRETGRMAADSLAMMGRIVTGKASLQNVFRPGHHCPGRQYFGQTWRGLVHPVPRPAVAESVHHQPAADPHLGRRPPAVLPYRVGQGQPAERACRRRRPIHRPGVAGRADGDWRSTTTSSAWSRDELFHVFAVYSVGIPYQ